MHPKVFLTIYEMYIVLSCYVQMLATIIVIESRWELIELNEFTIEFDLGWKSRYQNGAWLAEFSSS